MLVGCMLWTLHLKRGPACFDVASVASWPEDCSQGPTSVFNYEWCFFRYVIVLHLGLGDSRSFVLRSFFSCVLEVCCRLGFATCALCQ